MFELINANCCYLQQLHIASFVLLRLNKCKSAFYIDSPLFLLFGCKRLSNIYKQIIIPQK